MSHSPTNGYSQPSARSLTLGNTATVAVVSCLLLMATTMISLPGTAEDKRFSQPVNRIENVRLFRDGKLTDPLEIIISEGYISRIGPNSDTDIKGGKSNSTTSPQVIDGTGLVALPGLIDGHTHSYGTALRDALQFGVTTNLDMFTASDALPEAIKARAARTKTNNADLFSSGMIATAPGGHGTQFSSGVVTLEDAQSVDEWVAARKREGSDYIKLAYIPGNKSRNSIDRTIARALINAGHQQGLQVLAHISTANAARDMVEEGIDGLVHIFADRPIDQALVDLMVTSKTFVVPTLSIIASVDAKKAETQITPPSESLASRLSPMQQSSLKQGFRKATPGYSLTQALSNVDALHAAGVPILAGSDAPNPGTAHGYTLHNELALLTRAGLSPSQAVAAASSVTARIFKLEGRGRLEQGAIADLILISGDPTKDISNTLNIQHIIKNGYPVQPNANSNKAQ